MIRAVIFDMDGLLVDSEPLAKEAWQATARLYGSEITPELFARMLGLRQLECGAVVRAEFGLTISVEALCRQRNDLFLERARGRLKPMTGAPELVATLQARGTRLALATSAERRYVDLALRELRLENAFAARVVAEDVTRGKPAPDVYLLAARRLDVAPSDCLVLEDAPNGIAAAKAAGMWCVAVPNAYTQSLDLCAADACLPSLVDVRETLDALMAMRWVSRASCPPPCSDGACAEWRQQRGSG